MEGEASQYKRLLNRELLKDPNDGVKYIFQKILATPFHQGGAQAVFLYRFMQFMKYNRGTIDLQKWMTRFQLTGNKLIESSMDLLPDLETTSPEAIAHVAPCRLEHEARQGELAGIAAATPGQEPYVNVPWTDARTGSIEATQHRQKFFPFGFVSLESFDARSEEHTHKYHDTSWNYIRSVQCADLFLDMFCTTKTAVDNPIMQPSGIGQRRSFLVLEEGGLEGTDGYWAEDDQDGAEGFLDALEYVFWVYDDGFMMTLDAHGMKEGCKADRPDEAKVKAEEKEREKAEEEEDSSDQGKERPRERNKERPLSQGE